MVGGATGKVDTESLYVIDTEADRNKLGKNVRNLYFTQKSNLSVREGSRTAKGRKRGSEEYSDGIVKREEGGDVGKTVIVAGSACTRTLKRDASEMSDFEDLPVKKARLQRETLRSLRDSILEAVDAGRWYSSNGLSTNNVKFLLDEMYEVLRDMAEDQKDATEPIVEKFGKFMAKLVMSRPCFSVLQGIGPVFTNLCKIGGKPVDEGVLIEELAKVDVASATMPDLSIGGVVARTSFRKCVLYQDFMTKRIAHDLGVAKQTQDNQEKVALLEKIVSLGEVDSTLFNTAQAALTIFNEKIDMKGRLQYVCSEIWPRHVADLWAPDSDLGAAAPLSAENPCVEGWALDRFLKGCRALSAYGVKVQNPVIHFPFGTIWIGAIWSDPIVYMYFPQQLDPPINIQYRI